MRKLFKYSIAGAAMAAFAVAAAPVKAETYNLTIVGGHATHLPWMGALEKFFVPEVNKRLAEMPGGHKVEWTQAYGGTIAKVGGVLEAVKGGVANMGMVYTIFEPANLPLMSVTFQAPFATDNVPLLSEIIVEMNNETPELQKHWANQNQVFLGAIVADTDHIWTKKPIKTVEDLKGMKVGAAGNISLWAAGIDMVPVQGNFATHYNNLKTGVYDGLIAFTTGTYPIKIHEVAPYMTKVDLGSMLIGAITINKGDFDGMKPEVKQVLKDVGRDYSQQVAKTMMNLAGVFEKKMAEEGAKISTFPETERKKWATTMPNIAKAWVERNQARGLPAQKVLNEYMKRLRAAGVEPLRDWDKE